MRQTLDFRSPADLLDSLGSRNFRLATRLEIAHASFARLDITSKVSASLMAEMAMRR